MSGDAGHNKKPRSESFAAGLFFINAAGLFGGLQVAVLALGALHVA